MKFRERAVKRLLHNQPETATTVYHWIVRTHGFIKPDVMEGVAVLAADRRIAHLERERDDWMTKAQDINMKHNSLQGENERLRRQLTAIQAKLDAGKVNG